MNSQVNPGGCDATRRAYTILELLIVVGIVMMLATVLVPISATFKKRAEKAKCLSQMRSLHTCFVSHVTDKGHWPQLPDDGRKWDESQFYKFWIESLEPYGAARNMWLCPSDKLLLQMERSEIENKDRYFGTYVPTAFDKRPGTPFRWNQPWLVERGDMHGQGGHILMPDGSVHGALNPFHGR